MTEENEEFGWGEGDNPDEYDNESVRFWKYSYHVYLSEFDTMGYYINADNEGEALDAAIDCAEKDGYVGLFLSQADILQMDEDELEEHICGGNHGLYLSSLNVIVKKLD